jgi:triacylglycerol lipase
MQSEPAALVQAAWLGTAVLAVLLLIGLTALAIRAYAKRKARRELTGGARPEAREQALLAALDAAAADTLLATPPGVEAALDARARELQDGGAGLGAAERRQPRGGQAAAGDLLGSPALRTDGKTESGPGMPGSGETALAYSRSGLLVRIGRAADRRTRYPVVFAHGLFGFDAIEVGGKRHEYFRGISRELQRPDTEGYLLRVAPLASIAARARQLSEQIRRLPVERVNIVAHSMGGLDARYAISKLGLSDVVASLTTIGTPHRGTPIADLSCSVFGRLSPIDGLGDLTTTRMAEFNQRFPDVPGVEYRCFVSSVKGGISHVPKLLMPGYLWLRWQVGDNDGLVPVESQRWGDIMGHIDADHWGQIGWSSRFNAAAFYEDLVDRLGDQGL